jgi:hypothetical protein
MIGIKLIGASLILQQTKKYTPAPHGVEYTNMGGIFIVKHFKQIAMRVKSQTDITVPGGHALNRTVIAGIGKRMANIGFTHAVPESRLLELNFNAHLFNIAGMKRECKALRGLAGY